MYQLYKPADETYVRRLSDNLLIPMDTSNADYRAYLEWVAKGNTALPEGGGDSYGKG